MTEYKLDVYFHTTCHTSMKYANDYLKKNYHGLYEIMKEYDIKERMVVLDQKKVNSYYIAPAVFFVFHENDATLLKLLLPDFEFTEHDPSKELILTDWLDLKW